MEGKRTILFVANTAWSMYNFRRGVMQQLLREGYIVAVVAQPDNFEKRLTEMGINFYPLVSIRSKGKNPVQDLFLIKELYKLYRQIRPAFIFHYTIKPNIYGSIAAGRCNIPSIAITTGLGHVFSKRDSTVMLVRKMYRFALRQPKEVWFLNAEDKQTFLQEHIITASKAYLLKGEGVDTAYFTSIRKDSLAGMERKFILVARLIYNKGVKEYVEASALLQKKGYRFQSQVLGFLDVQNPEAIARQQIEDWEKKGFIHYLGSTADVKPFIDTADCMVLPSYYGEGIPRTLMEAASLGKPIITTNHVGCRDVVEDGASGYLCNIKDIDDLAAKMEKLLNLPAHQLCEMGRCGRNKMIHEFDEKLVIGSYLTALKKYL